MDFLQKEALNRFFVQTFNRILSLEEISLAKGSSRGLSVKELHTIEAAAELEKEQKNTMSQIAARLSISVGALTTAVNVLVNKGYLERRGDPNDRRVVQIFLTKHGLAAEWAHRRFHDEMIESIGKVLNNEQLDTLIRSLELLSTFFENKIRSKEEA